MNGFDEMGFQFSDISRSSPVRLYFGRWTEHGKRMEKLEKPRKIVYSAHRTNIKRKCGWGGGESFE